MVPEHFKSAAQVPNPKMDEVGTRLGVHPDFALQFGIWDEGFVWVLIYLLHKFSKLHQPLALQSKFD